VTTAQDLESGQDLDEREEYAPDGVHDRSDQERWAGVEVRGYVEPDLEILPRSKGGDGRTITGILVPFNRSQRIHEGLVERVRVGAADHQLARPAMMKFAREHLKLGGTLIGRAHELRNDTSGLWGALRASKTPAGDEAVTLVEDGALDELSIGFRAVRSRRLPDGVIERVRIDVLETALVLQGAYGRGARVTGLRSAEGAQDDAQGPEDAPAEQAPSGLSVAHARALRAQVTLRPETLAALNGMIR
jgi:Escherichia/Staphylococcus phage prohead protease